MTTSATASANPFIAAASDDADVIVVYRTTTPWGTYDSEYTGPASHLSVVLHTLLNDNPDDYEVVITNVLPG